MTTKTWIVIGDSIMSSVADGTSAQHALTLVSNERDVIFKNLSSPAASLGANDYTGFNTLWTVNSLTRVGGFFSAYDGVLIQAATNDFSRSESIQETITALRRILAAVRSQNKKALVLDAIWRADEGSKNTAGNNLNAYRFYIWAVCAYEYADVCHFASRLDTPMGTAAGAANYSAAEISAGNQLHPNAAGHRLLADWIKAAAATAGYF